MNHVKPLLHYLLLYQINPPMENIKKVGVIVINLFLASQAQAEIKISEVMPCNISTYMDKGSDGIDPERSYNFPGWVEFYNDGGEKSFKDYTITHYKKKKKGEFEFKASYKIKEDIMIGSSSYQILFFDEDTKYYKHMPFKLDSDGGSISLYNPSGEKVDSLEYGAMETHISYGRDGSSEGYMNPTPKKENNKAYKYSERVAKPKFSEKYEQPGVVSGNIKVYLDCAQGDTYYTLDGSEPKKGNENSNKFDGKPIDVGETTIIRARTFDGDRPASEILTGTFLYLDKYHEACGGGFSVPIVSISTDDDYLNDPEIGFLLRDGSKNGKAHPNSSCLEKFGAENFLQEHWKRPVVFEYIEDGKVTMVHETEASVMGGCSREWEVVSLKLKAGSKVGSSKKEFAKSPFKDKPDNKYTSLHLRNGGNGGNTEDINVVRVRDGFMQSLTKEMNIDYQAYQPVAYYLNGKYMGLMGLRERTNEDYVEANYGLEDDDIDLLKAKNSAGMEVSNGTNDKYREMIEFLENNDPTTKSYYEKACEYIDMDEYIDYQVFEHFIVNTDWPGNNVKIWRDNKGGKFRWIVYDTDFGLGLYPNDDNHCHAYLNTFKFAIGETPIMWSNGIKLSGIYVKQQPNWKVTIFYHLTKNPYFNERFVNKALIHLGTTFSYEQVKKVWGTIKNEVEDEFCAFAKKYGKSETNIGDLGGVNHMLNFATDRPGYMQSHMEEFFNLKGYIDFKLSSNIDEAKFLINGDLLNQSSYEGKQVLDKNLKVEPIAPEGYIFKHWEVEGFVGSTYPLDDQSEWKYFYQRESPEGDWKSADYDDSGWSIGKGKMGYDTKETLSSYDTQLDFGEKTLDKYLRAYFRTTFDMSKEFGFDSLCIDIDYDDGFILYLNGKEICRKNIAEELKDGKEIAAKTDNNLSTRIYLKSSDILAGENILAAVLCQKDSLSSDLTWKLDMKAIRDIKKGTTYKDSSCSFQGKPSSNLKLKAIFEEYSCDQMLEDYSVLSLNEVAPSNNSETNIVDEYGIHSDWFEIYNSGEDTLNLAGLYLSDDPNELGKSLITSLYPDSTTILPKGFIRFWADNAIYRGPLHADFKLSNTEPTGLYLSAKCGNDYQTLSVMSYNKLPQNASVGYLCNNPQEGYMVFDNSPKEGGDATIWMSPTPGSSNPPCIEEVVPNEMDCEELKELYREVLDVTLLSSNQNPGPNWLMIKNNGTDTIDFSEKLYLSTDFNNLAMSIVPKGCKNIAPNDSIVLYVGENSEMKNDSAFLSLQLPNQDSTLIYFAIKCDDTEIDTIKAINAFSYDAMDENEPGEPTFINDALSNTLHIYPNPTESVINIESEEDDILSVGIYDGMGRKLISEEVEAMDGQIDMSRFASGTYYLQIVTTREVVQHKVMKK